ncbi:hypothetical protein BC939DRAFT_453760 [Gamsiella multidivaricata]|uniref:uncharacterized protein n=1 Tax=Gamsiella multidivaricata TaxID=101098 RepID=UPI00221F765A|nr:uncharacterized protein BC939DRAFT_453760 [Gamsiella multidivaricata]KAG0369511.1 hypothetical protein BGZ54_009729 [Gamsiella multidivaricata]KAI7822605.1 hypothetical protein BC939DRAFT_453760 [Gamsiella multidivaricata]
MHSIQQGRPTETIATETRPTSKFALRLSTWLKDHKAAKGPSQQEQQHQLNSCNNLAIAGTSSTQERDQQLPSWVFEDLNSRPMPSPSFPSSPISASSGAATEAGLAALIHEFGEMTTDGADNTDETEIVLETPPQQQQQQNQLRQHFHQQPLSEPYVSFKRSQAKYKQSWRRTRPELLPRKAPIKRIPSGTQELTSITGDIETDIAIPEKRSAVYVPHDILLAIFSHLPSRANAQQYYDRTQPSDLLSCSRVSMAWRLAALPTIWQTIVLPDPLDRSCRRLLHLLASSYASAQVTGRNYDMTEMVQRVEVDLLEATELLADDRDYDLPEDSTTTPSVAAATADMAAMTDHITALLQYVSPFRTLSIQLPQEIESSAAEILTKTASMPTLEAIVRGIQDAQIKELDMPSPMYCSVSTFPGMLNLISRLQDLRVLILGYSSRDWPLLKAIISLPLLESLCVFDSCWSNQIWIYLLSSLGPRLRGLTVLQGRRPLQGVVLREGIAPYCRNLTSLSIPFIQLLSGPAPVLTNEDLIPVIKTCHGLQTINISGQRLLGDPVLEVIADLWGLQILDIRECSLMTGQNIKGVRWQSIQRVRVSGCGEISQEFMDLILQAWRSSVAQTGRYITGPSAGSSHKFTSVLDFNHDTVDPVEMGWVRQREDEPPLDLDEDHFFADWYV